MTVYALNILQMFPRINAFAASPPPNHRLPPYTGPRSHPSFGPIAWPFLPSFRTNQTLPCKSILSWVWGAEASQCRSTERGGLGQFVCTHIGERFWPFADEDTTPRGHHVIPTGYVPPLRAQQVLRECVPEDSPTARTLRPEPRSRPRAPPLPTGGGDMGALGPQASSEPFGLPASSPFGRRGLRGSSRKAPAPVLWAGDAVCSPQPRPAPRRASEVLVSCEVGMRSGSECACLGWSGCEIPSRWTFYKGVVLIAIFFITNYVCSLRARISSQPGFFRDASRFPLSTCPWYQGGDMWGPFGTADQPDRPLRISPILRVDEFDRKGSPPPL